MKSRIVFVTTLALCSLVWGQAPKCAKPTPTPTPTPVQPVGVSVTNSNTNNSSSTASASSTASSNQTQSQTQSATGGDANSASGGNTLQANTNVPRQAPMAYAPAVFSGACLGGFSAGASGPVGGVSFGGTKADKVCQSINLAQVFLSQGNYVAAAKILCSTKPAKEAKLALEDCLAFVRPEPAPIVQPVQPTIIVVDETPTTVNVTPTPEQLKDVPPLPKPVLQSKKPVVHKAKPCVIPNSLTQPIVMEK